MATLNNTQKKDLQTFKDTGVVGDSISNLYTLTKSLHGIIQEKAKKHGLEDEIIMGDWELQISKQGEFVSYRDVINRIALKQTKSDDWCWAIQAPQIRAILLAFQNKLGIKVNKFERENLSFIHDKEGQLILPLIESEPERVLTELLEILKAI